MTNEATFEGHLSAVLSGVFPASGPQVMHQVQFTVRLGHHDIAVDGRKGWEKKGRADVLLSANVGHVAILELKRPGLSLTEADRDQGLSYARLLTPMPPLTITSNGTETRFYQTIDGARWEGESVSDEAFINLVAGAHAIAATSRDEAIRSLLGANPTIWADFLRQHTADTLAARIGGLFDLHLPFARQFSVPRQIVARVLGRLNQKAPAVAVVGPPLSGKSVVLKQCCEALAASNLVPLYIDASSANQGPLRLLASVFAQHLFTATSLDQIRQWLSVSLRSMEGDTRIVLFLDELVPELNEVWLGDLDELLGLGESSPLSIVLAIDPNTLRSLSYRKGRPTKTNLGQRADVVHLQLLSDQEFEAAMEQLFDATRSRPYRGGQYNIEYREARVLRVIAASMPPPMGENTMSVFSSTSTVRDLEMMWSAYVRSDHELVDALRALARAYLHDLASRTGDAQLQLASYKAAAMRKDVAAELLPRSTLDWLLKHSFLSTRLGPNDEVLLLPRHLELFARAAAIELGEAVSRVGDVSSAYALLMERSDMLPLGDIVGAGALQVAAGRSPELGSRLLFKAIGDAPRSEIVPAGAVLEVSANGNRVGEIETSEPTTLEGNMHPWLVAAQVATLPLAGPDNVSPNSRIIATIGCHNGLLRRFGDARWVKLEGFHFHEIPGRGSVPCLDNGVLEPLGQAIITGFGARPAEMLEIVEYAISEDEFHLAWRLNAAAREMTTATSAEAAEAANAAVTLTGDYIREQYDEFLQDHGEHDSPRDEQAEDE